MNKKMEISQDAIEYQSDALELMNRRLPWWARYGLLWAAVLFTAAVVWACVSEVDVVVTGTGKIITDQDIVLQPQDLAVVKEVHVRVGDVVKAGQPLVTFDPTMSEAEVARLKYQLDSYRAEYDRYRAEFFNQEYIAGQDCTEHEMYQAKLFRQRQDNFQERKRYYTENIARIKASKASKEDSVENLEAQLKIISQLVQMQEDLLQNEINSLKETLQYRREELSAQGSVDTLRNSITELDHELAATESSYNTFLEEWRQEISSNLVEAERNLSSIEKQYEKAQQQASYDVMRAPVDATVLEMASYSAGSVVRAAPMVTLVPLNSKLEMEMEIHSRDIGKIKVGTPVRIKLTAFPYQKHGTLEGEIRVISENSFTTQTQPTQMQTVYRARVPMTGKLKNLPPEIIALRPGMEAQMEAKVGKRRIIEFILHPLIKALDESAREP